MIKIMIAFLLLFSLNSFGEIINTSKGEQELYVPETYEELKEAYIDMATLYLEERWDHEKSIIHVEDLLRISSEMTFLNGELILEANNLIEKLKIKNSPDIFHMYLMGTVGKDFINTNILQGYFVGLEISGLVLEKFIFSFSYSIPARIQINLGWKLF